MLTFGHGRLTRDQLADLLVNAGVARVIDVRRFPGSRANAAAARDAIPQLAVELDIEYRWDERLGGRRTLTAEQDRESPDTWWRVRAFRAYAGWTRDALFRQALPSLVAAPAEAAVMCSESVWWRCHRRVISDVLVLEAGVTVRHLMHDGRVNEHAPSAGARLGSDGLVVWDGSQ